MLVEVGADVPPMLSKQEAREYRRGVEVGAGRAPTEPDRDNYFPSHLLSYSTLSLYKQCKRKWQHRKIWRTKRDPDAQWDPARLAIGKCFHKILEDNDHLPEFSPTWYKEEGRRYRIEFALSQFELAKIVAMCIRYVDLHKASGLRVVANEILVCDEMIGGYIDSVLVDPDYTVFWLSDNKTAAGRRKGLEESIPRNVQLNMYAALRHKVVEQLPVLKGLRFGGILYRCTIKPAIKYNPKIDTDFWATVKRCTTETFQIKVRAKDLDPDGVMTEAKDLARELKLYESFGPRQKPLAKNLESCLAYGDNCEFWSQCHGKTASKLRSRAIVETADTLKAANEEDL